MNSKQFKQFKEMNDKSVNNSTNIMSISLNTKHIDCKEGKEELKLRQELNELINKVNKSKNHLERQSLVLSKTKVDLTLKRGQLLVANNRKNCIEEQLKQMIDLCHKLESEQTIKSIECQKQKQLMGRHMNTIEEKSNCLQLLVKNLKEEELMIEKEVKQLSNDLHIISQKESFAHKMIVEIPLIIDSKKSLETDIEHYLSDNMKLKLECDQLLQNNDILVKRNSAILKRLNNQLKQKQSYIQNFNN